MNLFLCRRPWQVILLCFFFVWTHALVAQDTLTLTLTDGYLTDAVVNIIERDTYDEGADDNWGTHPRFEGTAWSNSGDNVFRRSLLKVDLSALPENIEITSATFYLYSDPTVTSGSVNSSNSQLTGTNEAYLERVTSDWEETTVTWNTQPTVTETDRIELAASTSVTENLEIDITNFMNTWSNDRDGNYGMRLSLKTESRYRARNYVGLDHDNTALHPKIIITYIATESAAENGTATLTDNYLTDAVVNIIERDTYDEGADDNWGTHPRFEGTAWSNSGDNVFRRSLLKVDLSALPENIEITSATLYLYSDPTVTSGSVNSSNSQLTGTNEAYLERVTSDWEETTVTWNTQPSVTDTDRIELAASTSVTENLEIDITNFMNIWSNDRDANYGMRLSLKTESRYRARNYVGLDHSNTALHPKIVVSYTVKESTESPVQDKMDAIFSNLDQSYITTGILTDYGLDLADASLYNGTITTDNVMDITSWRILYGSLLSSVINTSSNLIHLSTINDSLASHWATYDRNNPTVDMPVLFMAYQSIREDALDENLLEETNGALYDVAGRTESPYITAYAFAAAPHVDHDFDGDVTFIARSEMAINSSGKLVSSFAIDFDDGNGYQTVTLDESIHIVYSTAGAKTIQYKIVDSDNNTYYSAANFYVETVSESSNTARYATSQGQPFIFPRSADTNCPDTNFPDPEAYEGSFYGATVTVGYGDGHTSPTVGCNPSLINPLIVVEGYDPSNFSAFGFDNWSYDDFLSENDNGATRVTIASTNSTLNHSLDDEGYDIVFVDFDEGTGDIIRNAYLLENIIQWVNEHKATGSDGTVVLGQSMGGLVARYAVCDMEKRWAANPTGYDFHDVRMLITQDSPHRGANVPLGFQAMVNDLADMRLTKIGLASYGVVGAIVGSFITLKDLVPALDDAKKLMEEPASRQMLITQDGKTNTFLAGDYRDMVSFASGYTPSFEMAALSNGSACGVGEQVFAAGDDILNVETSFYVNRLLFLGTTELATIGGARPIPGMGAIVQAAMLALVPITGKYWKTDFVVKACAESGGNEAYSGKIIYEKKILYIIDVDIDLYSGSADYPSGTLPWDSAPGGYYDMTSFQADLPDNPDIDLYPIIDVNLYINLMPAFTFVPTVSALDITTTPLITDALTAVYSAGVSDTYPSAFSDFMTQETDANNEIGSYDNSAHIQFTSTNGSWLLAKINGDINPWNCNSVCASDEITISGDDEVCGSTTYTVSPVDTDGTVAWSGSSNVSFESAPTTGTGIFHGISNAGTDGYIQADVTAADGCRTVYAQKDVTVTQSTVSFLYNTGSSWNSMISVAFVPANTAIVIEAYCDDEVGGATWELVSSNGTATYGTYNTSGSQFGVTMISATSATFRATMTNLCGDEITGEFTLVVTSTASATTAVTLSPNPAEEYVTVSVLSTDATGSTSTTESTASTEARVAATASTTTTATAETLLYNVDIYNSQQQRVRHITNLQEASTTIDVRDLPKGIYIIHLTTKHDVIRQKIIIQ